MNSGIGVDEIFSSKASRLLIESRSNKEIAIGVPHHAPAGVDRLPCNRWADENTGYLGRYIAEKLDCCSIVACNYTADVNKSMDNDYSKQLLQWNPHLLIEVHGHKRRKTENDIEITCGCLERNKFSVELADKLLEKCQKDDRLRWLKICGDFNVIYFQAKTARTIQYKGWKAYLFELAPELRFETGQVGGPPPQSGYIFCDYLLKSLKEIREI